MIPSPKPQRKHRAKKKSLRKKSKRRLNREADNLWSKAVKEPGFCRRCKRMPPAVQLHAAHIKPKGMFRNHALRCDLKNGLCLCYSCHLHWAHKDPIGFTEWLDKEIPGCREYLNTQAAKHLKFDPEKAITELKDSQ